MESPERRADRINFITAVSCALALWLAAGQFFGSTLMYLLIVGAAAFAVCAANLGIRLNRRDSFHHHD